MAGKSTYDAAIRSAMRGMKQEAEPAPDWTDRVIQQWQPIKPNPQGAGDFPNQQEEGMHSRDLLRDADPREVINPETYDAIIRKVLGV